MRIAAEVDGVQHPRLVAPQPVGVRGLEQHRVPEVGQPALAAAGPDAFHLLVGMVEERLQLGPGESPLGGVGLVVLDVHGSVPLVHDLHRVDAEPFFAGGRPLIERVGDEVAEGSDGLGVGADRRPREITQSPQVTEPLVHHRRRPLPGEGVDVRGERLHRVLPALNRRAGQVPGQLLIGEPFQHRVEDLLLRPQQRDPAHQLKPRRTRRHDIDPHRSTTLRRSRWMRESRIGCESAGGPLVGQSYE
ncbi:hypothetical protein [Streptomyces monashensis]|uniref:hypothetical protein n=1 Tax=Streptomyces monashensis TaxID=1678012 RepID=UPI0015A5918D|nr:hypothetical protein [Streptomyces monashensis]